ncbi:hypothetical protein PVAP13_6KG048135 [Panicum virgatum]|uniref:Uncharacterized protein n=1 Tax=Panicum virgatum TaxID=38727 RepID=A0A8T0R999_PANVG|nr:hypothetical protein PVAP13_6KG048135 [Panicum virgatum]
MPRPQNPLLAAVHPVLVPASRPNPPTELRTQRIEPLSRACNSRCKSGCRCCPPKSGSRHCPPTERCLPNHAAIWSYLQHCCPPEVQLSRRLFRTVFTLQDRN